MLRAQISIDCLPILNKKSKFRLPLRRSGDVPDPEEVAAVAPRVGCHQVPVGIAGPWAQLCVSSKLCVLCVNAARSERAELLEPEIQRRHPAMTRTKERGAYRGIKFSVHSDGEF